MNARTTALRPARATLLAMAAAFMLGCSGGDAPPGDAPAPAAASASAASASASAGTWAAWTKRPAPVFTGQYPLSGDPSVIRDGTGYRMSYTCFDPLRTPQGPEICGALSADGLAWTLAPVGDAYVQGRLLATGPGVWDTAHETSHLLKVGGRTLLYFVGYVDQGGIFNSPPSSIGLATSDDGLHFSRLADPVLVPTPGGYDARLVSSPSVIAGVGANGGSGYLMVYAGYCASGCANAPGMVLLGATSGDGVHWTKLPAPVLRGADVPWPNEGVGEAQLVRAPDGLYYLFMTVLQGTRPHQIGVARAASINGPWTFDPVPIVTAGGSGSFDEGQVVAPSVLIEGNKTRLWFHGFNRDHTAIAIGYAEAAWPLVVGP